MQLTISVVTPPAFSRHLSSAGEKFGSAAPAPDAASASIAADAIVLRSPRIMPLPRFRRGAAWSNQRSGTRLHRLLDHQRGPQRVGVRVGRGVAPDDLLGAVEPAVIGPRLALVERHAGALD